MKCGIGPRREGEAKCKGCELRGTAARRLRGGGAKPEGHALARARGAAPLAPQSLKLVCQLETSVSLSTCMTLAHDVFAFGP